MKPVSNLKQPLLTGYIQTPGWNGSNPYPSYMENCIMLTPPPDYVMFFSFFSVKINYGDKLKRFIGHCDSTKVLTGTYGYEPFLFPEKNIQRRNRDTYLSLHFISWSNRGLETGFRLRFSFHPETLKPERLPTLLHGETTWRWNCTESVWPDLANHFLCDLAPQCVDSEDEARCPYTTEKCGLHKMEIAERCYVFIPDSGRLSWLEADRECRENGGLLASLETQQEFEAVSSVIRPFTPRGIRIGLTSTRLGGKKASLNPMYTNTLHWESGSVVFSLLYVTQGGSEPCGVLSEWKTKHRYLFTPCNNHVHAAAVCELPSVSDPPTGTRQPPTLPLLNTTSVSRVPLMACPLQHLTHELLFCDQKSLCQSLEKGGHWFKTACNVQATGPRQPYFSCGILEDFVPFSLVCDFRVDCVSGRDEDFCVYPACQGNTRNCGNGQCVEIDKYCNGYKDCLTNVDEVQCPFGFHIISTVSLPAMVNFDKPRGFTVTPLPKDNAQCPATHFQCHDDGFCLPVYARCNNVNDCPGHEDEIFAVFALLGNFSSFVYRVCFSKESASTGFVVFVLHLCISDFLMGVYLGFIGIADLVYAGIYLWKEAAWKSSPVCSSAGFLSFLSSEVSAFIICLITVDRFLVLHFPFSQIRFGAMSAHVACSIVWILGLTLATVPLLPVASHWAFYQQTGICIPLPITKADFAGHTYSFSVMITCNLVVFLLIAVGQTLIYWSVTSNAISNQISETNNKMDGRKSKEAVIARRLLTIAVSDFMCWFPIGLCGLLAANHVLIPVEVNVALAIFILPLNSAINPFLYTLNVIQEKRRRAQERRHLQILRALQKN
ncbi:hypothetical protein ACOMHN_059768 [Nucella lapillus]